MAERPHREHRADEIEVEDLDFRRGLGHHVRNPRHLPAQQFHCRHVIGAAGQLALQLHAAIRVGAEILDGVAEDFAVADDRHHIVRGVDRGREQADLRHRAGDAADGHEVADLEGFEHDQESARREIRQQAAPGGADCDAHPGDQRGEAGGLDAKVAQDRDDQHDVQGDVQDVADVAHQRRVDMLALQDLLQQTADHANQPAAADPECQRREHLQAQRGEIRDDEILILGDVHGVPLSVLLRAGALLGAPGWHRTVRVARPTAGFPTGRRATGSPRARGRAGQRPASGKRQNHGRNGAADRWPSAWQRNGRAGSRRRRSRARP